ncbi:MAG: CNNM domain-containing protein [Elusimicrobiota bacterium]|nr:MAG: CNNM domain-containing protein [Elusimicrobiota bacterium]
MLMLLAAALIAANALFVLMEFALVRVRPSRIEVLARKGGRSAIAVQEVLRSLDDYLAACQVGITILSLTLGYVAEPTIAAHVERALHGLTSRLHPTVFHGVVFALSIGVLSWFHIVLGELVPRTLGIQFAEKVSLWGVLPLKAFAAFLKWPVWFLSASSQGILRLFRIKPASEADHSVTVDEMRVLLGETQEKGAMPLERLLLLENLFDFGSARVAEAMRPRERIVFLSLARPWSENLAVIREKRYSRYPLCSTDELDSAIGYVHVKDLLLEDVGPEPDLKKLRRDLYEIADSEPLEKLLKTLPDKGVHLAVVRDGMNRIVGLLTLEDILEELVGEVRDEFEKVKAWVPGEMFERAAVDANLPTVERKATIRHLMDRMKAANPDLDAETAFAAVWERELKFASAVGHGVLVPHARLPGLKTSLVAVGRWPKAPPLPTPDGAPLRLVFLILTPLETPTMQLKVLQRIASLIMNETLRRKILRAKTDDALLTLLRTADTLLAT